ncbi:MAG: hypothetical protein H6666_16305 [Ardenticatenaceae bacterium]|nr:hypothetical protein [Anaerolineales bacterium]MCB8919481.1 hypothetical protein [Ardenticatenaceae bacterium]
MRRHAYLLLLMVALLAVALACNPAGSGDDGREATRTALQATLNAGVTVAAPATATAAPAGEQPAENTPEPAPPAEDDAVVQARAGATATAEAIAARQTEQAVAAGDAAAATAAAVAPIEEELRSYGIDPAQGRVAWIHPPVEISASGYMTYEWDVDLVAVAKDFVVAGDITWNTQYGSTGCGYVMRSDANDNSGSRHLVIATRYANGEVLFVTQANGNLLRDEIQRLDANIIDPNFEWQNDTTNHIAVVGRGNVFSVYTNGTYIGDATASQGLEKGFVAFVALNESGTTYCRFDNAWLWLFN